MNLLDTYGNLLAGNPPSEGILSVEFMGHPGIFLGVDQDRDLYCLIKNDNNIGAPSKRLKSISVDYSINYQAKVGDSLVSGLFTSIKLPQSNFHLLEVFCTLLEVLIQGLPEHPTASAIHAVVDSLVELLSQKTGNIRDRVKGLFGELYLISESENTLEWVDCWHQEANATKDFSFPEKYLEVKTSESALRKHSFSEAQLVPAKDQKPTLIASVLIQSDPRGENVFDLLSKTKAKLSDIGMQSKLINLFFAVIGTDVEEAGELLFSVIGGRNGIRTYDAGTLPRPMVAIGNVPDRAISSISFDINFEIAEAYGVRAVPNLT
jgi:hypothetical protein